jgi:RHS repeat-associated protein
VLSDHLGTPRQILDSAKRLRWRWDNTDPFGVNAPNQNPQGLGGFGYNLRFPGQYFDAEAGLFYNYFRDYDPRLGRYVQSDPVGLAGGVNTYAYVGGNPIGKKDPRGLDNPGMGPYGPPPPPCVGCGSGWNENIVPDIYPEACKAHDNCYGTPGRSKRSCDWNLFKDSFNESGPQPNVIGPFIFYLGVTLGGADAYRKAQGE